MQGSWHNDWQLMALHQNTDNNWAQRLWCAINWCLSRPHECMGDGRKAGQGAGHYKSIDHIHRHQGKIVLTVRGIWQNFRSWKIANQAEIGLCGSNEQNLKAQFMLM